MKKYLKDNKKLMKYYNYEKNKDLNIDSLTLGSNRKIWWICEKGHEFESSINSKNKGFGCPYCSGHKVLKGYNDLSTTNPEILREWNYKKNKDYNPENLSAGSDYKVWWVCEKGHEWESRISNRIKLNRKCPYCSNRKTIKGYNDLSTTNPELLKIWDYKNNECTDPSLFTSGSGKKVWWICERGHEWFETIKSVSHGTRCPYCSGHRVMKGFNDLSTTNPELMLEWNYEKNDIYNPETLSSGSNYKVWWKCSRGHEWKSTIAHRIEGRNCPYCTNSMRSSFPEYALYFYLKKIYKGTINKYTDLFNNGMELDIFIPECRIGIEYDGEYYHSKKNSEKKEKIKYDICKNNNIKLVRIRENNLGDSINCDYSICYRCTHENYIELNNVIKKIINYVFKKNITVVDINRDRIEIISDYKKDFYSNNAVIQNSVLLKEWNYKRNGKINPNSINLGSNLKVWWICEKGHEWEAAISKRNMGNNCPYCSNKRILKGYNDLKSQNPDLIKEWDFKKNIESPDNIYYASHKSVWWKCNCCNGEWKATIYHRTIRNHNCPYCSNHRVLKGYNDIVTTNPILAKEWNYQKNGNLLPTEVTKGSSKKVWWKCSNGHEWEARICKRSQGSKCPYCKTK